MKKYVLMVSKSFMADHFRAGEETNFLEKIQSEDKIHTLRKNFLQWSRKANEINAGKAVLVLKQWTGMPYRTKQIELMVLTRIGVEQFSFLATKHNKPSTAVFITDSFEEVTADVDLIAKNDGLTRNEFDAWFKEDATDLAIIHFTDFRYLENN